MGWQLLDKPKTFKATKSLAKTYAEMEPAPHDRPLSERRLQVYEKLLNAGQFRPVTWASALCKETGELYRVNGKHTSTLLSGLKEMPEFYVTIEEYECDTLEDIAKLYATFDSNMQSRTANDIYRSFAATVPELNGCIDAVVRSCCTGIAYHKFGQDVYSKCQAAERAEMLLDYPEFVVWLNDLIANAPPTGKSGICQTGGQKSRHLLRTAVVAAAFATWSKAKGPATDFWMAVRDDSGAKPDLPDRKLSRWLLTSSLTAKQHTKIRKAGTRETYVKCLHAWNAWRKNEATNLNYYAEGKIPSVV